MYPSVNGSFGSSTSTSAAAPVKSEPRKVRALYDFEAAEDNELTFLAGEIIHVVDDTDPNWWKGYNHRGEGLFPSNFVSADLSAEPESTTRNGAGGGGAAADDVKKSVQFSEDLKKDAEDTIEINEEKIDRLLHLLNEANPEDASEDSAELLQLEAQVSQMLPLIHVELERVDRKHAQLTMLNSDLVEAVNLYNSLVPDRIAAAYRGFPSGLPPPTTGMYAMPPNMYGMPPIGLPPHGMQMNGN